MKLVESGFAPSVCTPLLHVWELPPQRRTITWKDQRFFVPFPWTYFITGAFLSEVGYVLWCGIRPQKTTPDSKKIHLLHTDNLMWNYQACLGLSVCKEIN